MFWFQEEKKTGDLGGCDSSCCCMGVQGWEPPPRDVCPKRDNCSGYPWAPPLLLLWVLWCTMWMCLSLCLTHLSLTCGAGGALSHLAARASPVSVEQQGPAPGRGRGPGGMLWPRAAAGVSDGAATPVSWVTAGKHVPLTWMARQSRCPLPGTQGDVWRLMLPSEVWFRVCNAFRGARTISRDFIYIFDCYWNLKDMHTSWFLLFKSTSKDSKILTSHLIPCAS